MTTIKDNPARTHCDLMEHQSAEQGGAGEPYKLLIKIRNNAASSMNKAVKEEDRKIFEIIFKDVNKALALQRKPITVDDVWPSSEEYWDAVNKVGSIHDFDDKAFYRAHVEKRLSELQEG